MTHATKTVFAAPMSNFASSELELFVRCRKDTMPDHIKKADDLAGGLATQSASPPTPALSSGVAEFPGACFSAARAAGVPIRSSSSVAQAGRSGSSSSSSAARAGTASSPACTRLIDARPETDSATESGEQAWRPVRGCSK